MIFHDNIDVCIFTQPPPQRFDTRSIFKQYTTGCHIKVKEHTVHTIYPWGENSWNRIACTTNVNAAEFFSLN